MDGVKIGGIAFRFVIFGICCALCVVKFFFYVARKNYQPLKSRCALYHLVSPFVHIGVTASATFTFYVLPCPLHIAMRIIFLPMLFSLVLSRCVRLFFLFRFNATKMKVASLKISNSFVNYPSTPRTISPDCRVESEEEENMRMIESKRTRWTAVEKFMAKHLSVCVFLMANLTLQIALSVVDIGINSGRKDTGGFFGYDYWKTGTCKGHCISTQIFVLIEIFIVIALIVSFAFLLRKVRDGFNITKELLIEIAVGGSMTIIATIHIVISIIWESKLTLVDYYFSPALWCLPYVASSFIVSDLVPFIQTFTWQRSGKAIMVDITEVEKRIETALDNPKMTQLFREFCAKEFSLENYLFCMDFKEYKAIKDTKKRSRLAKYIIAFYVQEGSSLELNINNKIRASIMSQDLGSPPETLFDELKEAVVFLMRDTYGRFLLSHQYLRLKEKEIEDKLKLQDVDLI